MTVHTVRIKKKAPPGTSRVCITYGKKSKDQLGKVANPARGQL